MKLVLDACVLYPIGLRGILLALAKEGVFEPIWSPRILEEWARATHKLGPAAHAQAMGEIAVVRATFPNAETDASSLELNLPDPNDVHVVETAVSSGAETIITLNLRDFPARALGRFGVSVKHPDVFLTGLDDQYLNLVAQACRTEHATAARFADQPITPRQFLKKSRLPRLAKRLLL